MGLSSISAKVRSLGIFGLRRGISIESRKNIVGWMFVAPALFLYIAVVAVPALASVYIALTKWSGINISQAEYIGLRNFADLLDDKVFWLAFRHNLWWLVYSLTIPTVMGLFVASILAPIRRGAMGLRTVVFVPYMLPPIIAVFIWEMLLNPGMGVGAWLATKGIPGLDIAFFGRRSLAMPTIAFLSFWRGWGFTTVLFLTAMQNIPMDLYDAAKVDGASGWHQFRHVTLPGIMPTVAFWLMMSGINAFQVFQYIFMTTEGGPARSTEVLATYLVENLFRTYQAGYAAAIGLSISVLAACLLLLFVMLRRRYEWI